MSQLTLDIDGESFVIDCDFEKSMCDDRAVPVDKSRARKGMACAKCKDFNEYAEPNQKDGSHKCYRCRNGL